MEITQNGKYVFDIENTQKSIISFSVESDHMANSSGNPGYSINVDSEGKVLTITSEDGAAHEVNFVMQYV